MAGTLIHLGENAYRLQVSAGTDGNGKRIRHSRNITASSDREAEKQLALFVSEVERGVITNNPKITFKELTEIYLQDQAEHQLAPKTLFRYKQLLDTRILAALGNVKLDKLTPTHLLKFYTSLRKPGARQDGITDRGLSERSILHHHRLIHTLLTTAVQWGYLSTNPADRCKAPRVPRKEAASYSQEEVNLLLEAAASEPFKYRLLILLAIGTGARQGELMALEWQHIDFDTGTIKIEQASQYLPKRGTFTKSTKNNTVRTVQVPLMVIEALKAYRHEQNIERLKLGSLWQAGNRIFVSETGRPMYPSTMSSWFPKFLRRHKLRHLPFHGLRHTSASLLIAQGATSVDLSKRLGHSTTTTTMNIYAHSFEKADSELSQKMDTILSNKSTKTRVHKGGG